MLWAEFLIFLLLAAGLFSMGDIRLRELIPNSRKEAKKPLTNTVQEARGQRRKAVWQEGGEIDRLLIETEQPGRRRQVLRASVLLLAVGAIIPALLGNPYLSPVTGVGAAMLPLLFLRQRQTAFRKNRNAELETAVSVVTTSYLRSEDLIQSVKENLLYMGPAVRKVFANFVYSTEMINANVPAALHNLKAEIPNSVFGEWCDAMIQCQSDRSLKHTLLPALEKFSDVRVVQSRLETLLSQPRREAVTMMLLVVMNIPLLYFLNKDWYAALLFSTPGRITLAICAGVVLFSAVRIMKLSRPIEYT